MNRFRVVRAVALAGALSVIPCLLAQARPRKLPPAVYQPRTREEWQSKRAAEAKWEGNFAEEHPEAADAFDYLIDRTRAITNQYFADDAILDVARADELIGELYVDVGDARLNPYMQDLVVSQIGIAARKWPEERLPAAARQRLVNGLMEYYGAGGGRCWPYGERNVARTLMDLDRSNDPGVRVAVEDLLWDAFDWAYAVDSDIDQRAVARTCVEHWGDDFWFEVYDKQLAADALPKTLPERYGKIVEKLRTLIAKSSDDKEFTKLVTDASESALIPFHDERLTNDVLNRLLIVYRWLLERKPIIPGRACEYIERQLLKLAGRESPLKTDQHWELWEKAVNAVGPRRVSQATLSFIEREAAKEKQPPARRAAMQSLTFLKEARATLGLNQPQP